MSDLPNYVGGNLNQYGEPSAGGGAVTDVLLNNRAVMCGQDPRLPRGYRWNHNGTTLYNPKPEDKEYETLHGERKYHARVEEGSADALVRKNRSLENEMSQLKEKLDVLQNLVIAAYAKNANDEAGEVAEQTEQATEDIVPAQRSRRRKVV